MSDLRRYGLTENPFDGEYAKELQWPDQEALFADVYGFRKRRSEIEEWFCENGESDDAKFFVVEGPRGGGRSSLISFIIDCYKKSQRKIDKKRELLVVPLKIDGDFTDSVLPQWARELNTRIVKGPFTIEARAHRRLRSAAKKDTSTDTVTYQEVFVDVAKELIGKGRRVVAIFDGVNEDKIIELCKEVFIVQSPLVIFVQGRQEVGGIVLNSAGGTERSDPEWPKDADGMRVPIEPLGGDEVVDLFDNRWRETSHGLQSPFRDASYKTLREVFEAVPAPTRLAVRVLGKILTSKLDQKLEGAWPDDSLWVESSDVVEARRGTS